MVINKLVCFIGFLVITCYNQILSQQINTNPLKNQLFWEISGNGLKKSSYIFGSYHSNDPRVFNFSDSIITAFLRAEAIILEADIYQLFSDYENRINTNKFRFDSEGNAFTSSKSASQTKYGSEDGRPQFLDLYFQQIGQNMQKKILALETIDEQFDAFEAIFERSVSQKKLEDYQLIQDKYFNAYLKGDIETIRMLIESQLKDTKSAYDRLITKRNVKMANGIDTLCRKHSSFIVVGAGHLSGNDGILNLLRKKGFLLKQVVPSYSFSKDIISKSFAPYNKYQHIDSKHHFTAVFGSIPVRDTNSQSYKLIYHELGQGNTYIIEIEQATNSNLKDYYKQVINPPEKAKIKSIMHQNIIEAYEGIGYEYGIGDCWKRIFIKDGNLVKLICYGGNKFMNSNRPITFFNHVVFD
jgi:uncharacterized protein YbaP (TraB family)